VDGLNRLLNQLESLVMFARDYWFRGIWVRVQFETFGAEEFIEFNYTVNKSFDCLVGFIIQAGCSGLSTEDLWQNVSHASVIEFSFFFDRFKWLRVRRPGKPCHGLTASRDQCSEVQEGLTLLFPYLFSAVLPPVLSFRESLLPASYHSAQ